jgi:hypothetical protein
VQFVLLVGCIGLAVYTATQVFGWNGVVLRQTWPDQGEQHSTACSPAGTELVWCQRCCPSVASSDVCMHHNCVTFKHILTRAPLCVLCAAILAGSYQQQQQYPPNQPPPGQGYPGQQAYRQQYGHQQFGRQQQQGNGRQGEQGDLVDVFHYPRPAPQ